MGVVLGIRWGRTLENHSFSRLDPVLHSLVHLSTLHLALCHGCEEWLINTDRSINWLILNKKQRKHSPNICFSSQLVELVGPADLLKINKIFGYYSCRPINRNSVHIYHLQFSEQRLLNQIKEGKKNMHLCSLLKMKEVAFSSSKIFFSIRIHWELLHRCFIKKWFCGSVRGESGSWIVLAWFYKVDVKVKGAQSYPTLCNPMDYTVHGIHQARILEWVAFPFFRGSSQPRDRTQVSRIAGRFFTSWATREALIKWIDRSKSWATREALIKWIDRSKSWASCTGLAV